MSEQEKYKGVIAQFATLAEEVLADALAIGDIRVVQLGLRQGDLDLAPVDDALLEDLSDILPGFKAPAHRYAIATYDGDVHYEDVDVGDMLDLAPFMVAGHSPSVQDLGPI